MSNAGLSLPRWAVVTPLVCLTMLGLSLALPPSAWLAAASGVALTFAVLAAVHHAEVVAHRVGEPFGTLILALAVTIIEVGLIASLMLAGGPGASTLARDTVFAAVMIVSNGVLGLCLLVGGVRHLAQNFRRQGTSSLLAVLAALSTLTLVLPNFTTTTLGPTYSPAQLLFAAVASLGLYGVFVLVQTVTHREDFLGRDESAADSSAADHGARALPTTRTTWVAFGLLFVSLIAVVGLAKTLAPAIEAGVASIGAPKTVVGIAIALLVLLPETWAALRAAHANRLQDALNLALGSGLASIGLTVPVVAAISYWLDRPLILGLEPSNLVLLVLTFIVGTFTLGTGRTTILQGAVHLVILAAFVVLAFAP